LSKLSGFIDERGKYRYNFRVENCALYKMNNMKGG